MTNGFVIETDELTKRYEGGILAVDRLALRVRRGEVYGFVGPNGAGKTTALRMLVGLIQPSSGTARVLDQAPGTRVSLARVGAMIEAPAFYPYLSGRDNLRVMARHAGATELRIDPVLEQVELTARARDRFQTYSMGMKQRLGLAAALLKDPDVLILDEPTNGLDPEGIAEMRRLVRSLGSGDRTVLLSSHLMTEVEQICNRVGVIRSGRLVAEGTLDELRGEPQIRVRAAPVVEARDLVTALPCVEGARIDDGVLILDTKPCRSAEINRYLIRNGIEVGEIAPMNASLEDVFLTLIHQEGANING